MSNSSMINWISIKRQEGTFNVPADPTAFAYYDIEFFSMPWDYAVMIHFPKWLLGTRIHLDATFDTIMRVQIGHKEILFVSKIINSWLWPLVNKLWDILDRKYRPEYYRQYEESCSEWEDGLDEPNFYQIRPF